MRIGIGLALTQPAAAAGAPANAMTWPNASAVLWPDSSYLLWP